MSITWATPELFHTDSDYIPKNEEMKINFHDISKHELRKQRKKNIKNIAFVSE
jgi:hypothetical protein